MIMSESLIMLKEKGNNCSALQNDGNWIELGGSAKDYLDALCHRHGSTIEGRQRCFADIMHARQKLPVLVSEVTHEIWFPLSSMKDSGCIWISCISVLEVKMISEDKSSVLFMNGIKETVPCNVRVLRRQIKRCRAYLKQFYDVEAPKKEV